MSPEEFKQIIELAREAGEVASWIALALVAKAFLSDMLGFVIGIMLVLAVYRIIDRVHAAASFLGQTAAAVGKTPFFFTSDAAGFANRRRLMKVLSKHAEEITQDK